MDISHWQDDKKFEPEIVSPFTFYLRDKTGYPLFTTTGFVWMWYEYNFETGEVKIMDREGRNK